MPFLSSFYRVWLEKLWPLRQASCLTDAHNHAALLGKVTLGLERQSGIIPWAKLCKCSIFMRPRPARGSSRKGNTEASEAFFSFPTLRFFLSSLSCMSPPSPLLVLHPIPPTCHRTPLPPSPAAPAVRAQPPGAVTAVVSALAPLIYF